MTALNADSKRMNNERPTVNKEADQAKTAYKALSPSTANTLNESHSVSPEEEDRLQRNLELIRSMPDNIGAALAKARTQPSWCSDRRWRMELCRRRHRY